MLSSRLWPHAILDQFHQFHQFQALSEHGCIELYSGRQMLRLLLQTTEIIYIENVGESFQGSLLTL